MDARANTSFAVPAAGVAANSDRPVAASDATPRSRNPLPTWRLLIIGGWVLLIAGFAAGEPADEVLRHWWVDGAWTLTYLATTLLSLWAMLTLKGRDRMAWGFFRGRLGSWFVAQLIWDYYELLSNITTPFPAISDLFYLLFAPLYAIGLMFFGEKPKGTAIGPKVVSQLVMIGAAVYAAVGLHVSEAIVGNQDGPLYVATSVAYPAALRCGVPDGRAVALPLCVGRQALRADAAVVGLACHAARKRCTASACWGANYQVGQIYDFLWLAGRRVPVLGGRRAYPPGARPHRRRAAGRAVPDRGLSPRAPAGAADPRARHRGHLAHPRARCRGLTRTEALVILTPACFVFAIAVAIAEGWSWRIEDGLRRARRDAALEAQRSESRLAAMLEIAPTAIIAIDQNHAIRLCSKARKLFGYAAPETIGLPMTLLFSDEATQKGAAPLAPGDIIQRCAAATSRAAPIGHPVPAGRRMLRAGRHIGRRRRRRSHHHDADRRDRASAAGARAAPRQESAEAANRAKTQFLAT